MGIAGITEQRSKNIDSTFQYIRDDVLTHLTDTMPTEAVEWFRCNLDYNVLDGKPNNIMSVVDFVEILQGQTLSDNEYFKAALLEWCIKLLQASRSYVFSNDKPNKHRHHQCWYAGDDIVIKDSLWLDVVIYYLLKKYFRTETYYVQLLELFQDTTFQTELGHLVNFITLQDYFDLCKFSPQRYALITRRKVTSFYLPVTVAMCICGVPESYTLLGSLFFPYTTARSILLQLGEYFQIQADCLNYDDTVKEASKGKCSWCINLAPVVSSPEQRKVLEEHFGRMEPEKEMQVKEIYETRELKEQFQVYAASLKEQIEALIAEIPEPEGNVNGGVLKREVFSSFFDENYKRAT